MVDTGSVTDNGASDSQLSARTPPTLPEFVTVTKADLQGFPSPGTQRALKAETGKDYLTMVGPNADSADRTQTQVWTKLRREIPGLRWGDCEEVGLLIDDADAVAAVNPTSFDSFAPSPGSADSGG
jgi:hypothetical protein